LQDANLTVKVWFEPVIGGKGAHTTTFFNFKKSAEDQVKIVSQDKTKYRLVRAGSEANAGNYVVHVRITYATSQESHERRRHRWDDDDDGHGHHGHDHDFHHGAQFDETLQWDNHTPSVASPHTFTFLGV